MAVLSFCGAGCCGDAPQGIPFEPEPILVDAGPDQTAVVGATVSLTGSNNGNTASHKWAFFIKPADSASEIQDELSLTGASFVADAAGQYEIELVGATSSNPDAPDINPAARDTVVITAESGVRLAPSATTRVGIEDGRLKLIEVDGLVDIGPLFPGGAGDGDEIRQLAYDWTTHVLYGANVGRGSDFPNRRLFTIDLCIGEATEVGELRRPDGEAFFLLEGLAIDSAGEIYVSGTLGDVLLRSPTLLTVSTEGGVATEVVGDMGATIDGIDGGADADRVFATGDGLYISDSAGGTMMPPFDTWLYEVDPSDPSITVDLNPQGISAEFGSLAWDPLSDWVEAIDWSTGSWYKVRLEGGVAYLLAGLPPIDGPFSFVDRDCQDCVTPPTFIACLSPPPSGRIAWWTFDADGTDIESGLNGTLLNGATAAASGLVSGALTLDGNDDFVDVPSAAAITTPSGLTLDAWVNATTLADPMTSDPDDGAIVSKYNSSPGTAEVSWYLGRFSGGRLRLTVCEAWPADCTAVDTVAEVLTEGCWHFVAATFDATAAEGDQAKIYVDGAEVVTSPNSQANGTVQSIADTSVPVRVGTFTPISGVDANHWHGFIDELEIYGRALSSSEIVEIYDAGTSGHCKPDPAQ